MSVVFMVSMQHVNAPQHQLCLVIGLNKNAFYWSKSKHSPTLQSAVKYEGLKDTDLSTVYVLIYYVYPSSCCLTFFLVLSWCVRIALFWTHHVIVCARGCHSHFRCDSFSEVMSLTHYHSSYYCCLYFQPGSIFYFFYPSVTSLHVYLPV